MDLPEVQQANYLTRALRYADENWPWMGAMFVWNLDWYDYNWLCQDARYFSLLKVDYTDYSPFSDSRSRLFGLTEGIPQLDREGPPGSSVEDTPSAPYATTLAYDALAAFEKREGHFGPRLTVEPAALAFLAGVTETGVITQVVVPLNAGYRVLTWTAQAATGAEVVPSLAVTTGLQGMPLTVTVDSSGYTATYTPFTGSITVTSESSGVLDSPVVVSVTLYVLGEPRRVFLPVALRSPP